MISVTPAGAPGQNLLQNKVKPAGKEITGKVVAAPDLPSFVSIEVWQTLEQHELEQAAAQNGRVGNVRSVPVQG